MTLTVVQHALARLRSIGVTDIFGVPGDYSFALTDAICDDPHLRWIGCCNELNAAFAADGYARVKGMAALCTTYGVGELSALSAIAGAYAEHLPLFHLVGAPPISTQSSRALMHHTLGNGEYDLFRRMTEPVVCAFAVMTPQNVASEVERLIFEALYHRRPVYMVFPADFANQPVLGEAQPIPAPRSDPASLAAVTELIATALQQAQTACILAGFLVARTDQRAALQAVIDTSGLPFSTMLMDKSVLEERQPAYAGMYCGSLMNEDVREFVESRDVVLSVGAPMTDFNTGAFTSHLDPAKTIVVSHHRTQAHGKTYGNVEMGDLLAALARRLPQRDWDRIEAASIGIPTGGGSDPISAAALYPRWESFLLPHDIFVVETGTVSMGLGFAMLPRGVRYHNQTLWGSIGWATPAAFGAAVAAPDKRVILVTGEGAHQFTVQEVGQFARFGLKPIIFVLNNNGYLIERLICKNPQAAYNDIAPWHYSQLPRAFGCDDWLTARVTTCAELDEAMRAAANASTGAYIEVVTDAYAASQMAMRLHHAVKTLYKA